MAFDELIKSCGVGLLLASGLVQAPAATARPAAAAETLYLGFPQFDPVPEFSLVSVQLLQTRRTMNPPLEDLAGHPGLLPAIGVMTLVVAGPADPLVNFLEAHPGLTVTVWNLLTGDSLTLADCRLLHPLPEGQGRPPQLALQLSYAGITFAAEAS